MRPRRLGLTLAWVLALCLIAAACGSQLDPETVRAANGTTSGGIGSEGNPDGTLGGTSDTGSPAGDSGGGVNGGTGGSTGGGTAGGSGTTGGGAAGGGSGSGGGGGGGGALPKGASCDGFKNQTGITDSKVVIANASDVSGPVPGLFEASQDAVRAYAAYFNSTSDLCGRKLEVMTLDSRTDAGADQQAYVKACESAFAAVGSMSAFDSGGAAAAQGCGLPDIRSAPVTRERNACNTCFGAQSTNANQFQNAVPDYFLKNYREASQNAAYLYINAGAGAQNAVSQYTAMGKRGMRFVYTSGIDVSEFNYSPYVQQMQKRGVKWVQFLGAYQQAAKLAQAMQQQDFEPEVFLLDPTAYTSQFIELGGAAVEGTMIFVNFTPFAEAANNRELALYTRWLQQIRPGAEPTFFGLFSWSAAKLFVEQSLALGGRLSRTTLVDRFRNVDNWTADGLHAAQHVGAKNVGDCWRFVRIKGGRFVSEGGTRYQCSGVTKVG